MLFIVITLFLSTHNKYSAFVGLSVRFRFQDPRQLLIRLSLLFSYSPSGLSVHSCSLDPRRPPELLFSFHFFQFSLLTWVSQRISAPKTHASSFICSFCSGSRFHSCFPRVSQSISVPKTHAGFLIQIKSFAFF